MSSTRDRVFYFHADASALGGLLTHPQESVIEARSSCSLSQAGGKAEGAAGELRLDRVVHVESTRTDALGAPRANGGWSTTVTATAEGLKLLDIVEADRLTARLVVEHPAEGYIPKVSLLGSSIENLRIDGKHVDVPLDLQLIAGSTHSPDTPWPKEPTLLRTAAQQSQQIADSMLPEPLRRRYASIGLDGDRARKGYVLCSLVKEIKSFQGEAVGHILVIPDFGVLFLAELIVTEAAFSLTMLRAELDGALEGTVGIATAHVGGVPMP